MEVTVNYWAVVLAAVSSMAIGAIWYMPGLFGNRWMNLAKVKMDKKMTASTSIYMYGLTFVASLVTAYILAHVTFLSNSFFHDSFLQDALTTAFWLWLGLTVARFLVHDLFEGRPAKLTAINAGHELFTIMVMALIIGWMGV
jgi:hypothetical protein